MIQHVQRLPDGSFSGGDICPKPPFCAVCHEWSDAETHHYIQRLGGPSYMAHRAKLATESARRRSDRALEEITPHHLYCLLRDQWLLCPSCGSNFEHVGGFDIEHRIPLVRGGTNRPSNLQLLCNECNVEKGILTPKEFDRATTYELDGQPNRCPKCKGYKDEEFQLCYRCRYPELDTTECPECGEYKQREYRLCYDCSQEDED